MQYGELLRLTGGHGTSKIYEEFQTLRADLRAAQALAREAIKWNAQFPTSDPGEISSLAAETQDELLATRQQLATALALALPDGALLTTHVDDETRQWIAVVENSGIVDAHGYPMPPVKMMSQGSTRDEAIRSVLSALTLMISVLRGKPQEPPCE